jgi:voltage-gated potassium channel
MRKELYHILNPPHQKGELSWYVDVFIIVLIALNVVAIVLESMEALSLKYANQFRLFEIFSVAVFSVEYILRFFTANENPQYRKPIVGNLKFALSPMAVIDLLAVVPFYLSFFAFDLRILRMLRLFRLFRLFKLARYVEALSLINRVFSKKKDELIISLIFTLFLLLFVSSIMYFVENEAQPDNFSSIPETMWWGIATLTTVGYGDIYPITPLGHFLGGIIALIGIGLFALPTGILASGFSDEITAKKNNRDKCESCGQSLASIKEGL